MENIDVHTWASRKAFEISYALLRLTRAGSNPEFGKHLESRAYELLKSVTLREYANAIHVLTFVEYFTRLGVEAGAVSLSNAEIVNREVSTLRSAISEFNDSAILPDVNLEDIFSSPHLFAQKKQKKQSHQASQNEAHDVMLNENSRYDDKKDAEIAQNSNSAIRQSAIIGIVRQNSACRIKDLQDAFPGVSERTLRYDLARLVEGGIVQKVGNSGPATFYRMKEGILESYVRGAERGEEI